MAVVTTLIVVGCTSTTTDGAVTPPPDVNTVFQFESEQLADNDLGVSPRITVGVLVPNAYFSSDDRFPVLYFLPGYTAYDTAADMPDVLGEALNATEPMIVVTVTGANELGGGWYTDSTATGNWEQALVTEIVPYIDDHYRTIESPAARGLAGHSMGGYGALTIGMKHADVFGSVFAMSPAVAGARGIGAPELFGSESGAWRVLSALEALDGLEGEALLDAMSSSGASYEFSYGTAFAPSPEPPYFRYPYAKVDGGVVRDDAVWALWQAGFGEVDAEIAQHREALASLEALGLDCGRNDEYQWIFEGCDFVDAELTAQGVPHVYTVHNGTHTNRFAQRMTDVMLPFFAEVFGKHEEP
ncbi:alpha/beta hydrolase-fold protein [Demequina sp.]|uniref:alpha/beta hydrolase n=1 Tax=Demequina sp. TaxID=2050685 RepID=UPI0025C176D5|nr:alpha/beta hydrolase-fold protein [Demequina sp.]